MTRPAAPVTSAATEVPPAKLWTRTFVLVCTATVACYSSQYFLVPLLPIYVTESGSSTFVAGLFFAAFSVMSFFVRPFIGKLADTWSIGGVLLLGSLILGLSGLAFLVPVLALAFVVNTVRGIGWAAINTASSTAVAVVAPPSRRGQASGTYSVATTVGAGLAPAASLWLFSQTGGLAPSFLLGGLFGLVAAVIVVTLPPLGAEATRGRGPFTVRGSGFSFDTFIDRRVLLASLLLLSVTTTGTVAIAFVPMHALSLGVDNISWYFLATGTVAVLGRLFFGRYLDQLTRGFWIVVGLLLGIVAFAVLSMATGIGWFVAGGVLNGLALSLSQPSLMAVAMDRADPAQMGRAMATYSMFFRAGEAIGAPMAGALIVAFGYPGMYFGAIASLLLGLVGTLVNWRALALPANRGRSAS
jgi:MFS family permease